MAIVSMMGNLTLEVNTMKNILVVGEKEKSVLQEELDKEKKFYGGRTWQKLSRKIKYSLRNFKMKMRSSKVAQHGCSHRMKNCKI